MWSRLDEYCSNSLSSSCLVWVCSLVYRLIGRIKEVKDCTAGSEKSYYTSLLNSKNMVCVMHLMSLVCSI